MGARIRACVGMLAVSVLAAGGVTVVRSVAAGADTAPPPSSVQQVLTDLNAVIAAIPIDPLHPVDPLKQTLTDVGNLVARPTDPIRVQAVITDLRGLIPGNPIRPLDPSVVAIKAVVADLLNLRPTDPIRPLDPIRMVLTDTAAALNATLSPLAKLIFTPALPAPVKALIAAINTL